MKAMRTMKTTKTMRTMRTVAQKHQVNHWHHSTHVQTERANRARLPLGSAINDVTTCKYSTCNSSRMYSCTSCNCNTVSTGRDLRLALVLLVLLVLPLDKRIISQPCKSNAGGGSGGPRTNTEKVSTGTSFFLTTFS